MNDDATILLGAWSVSRHEPFPAGGLSHNLRRQESQKLIQVCQEVEALFLQQLLGQLRRTLLSGLRQGAPEFETFQALADQEVAKALAAGGGLGLARRLLAQLNGERLAYPHHPAQGVPESDEQTHKHSAGGTLVPAALSLPAP
jgi:flagellar protein FlgJ